MARIVILGAGLTGLSTAYHLEKNNIFDFSIFEKEETVGGLCRSVTENGFTFDFTGHLLHANDPYFFNFLETIVGLQNLATINRRSFIYSHDAYTAYPFQTNLYGLPHEVIIECITGFVEKPALQKNPRSFYDWALQKFGSGITKHFFKPYQEKIFAHDVTKITASWTGRFVPETSLATILRGAFNEPKDQSIGYNAQFFYPKQGGINFWITKLAQHIKTNIQTDAKVTEIDLKHKMVFFENGQTEQYEILINTMPLDRFLKFLKTSTASSLSSCAKKLLCNSVINFNLGINRPDISDKHWIYLPEKKFIPYRLGFYHNFSELMAPKNCSSLYGEIAYLHKLNQPESELIAQAKKQLQKLLSFTDQEIIAEKVIQIDHAYVLYDFWREKNIANIHQNLIDQSVYSIGRYGAWKYASMQESLLDGKVMAETLQEHVNNRAPYKNINLCKEL